MTRAVLTVIALSLASCSLHAQSLADVAKKTEEERAKAKQEQTKSDDAKNTDNTPAAKVYTNKDLGTAAETKTEPAAKDTSNKTTPNEPVKDEAYWRGRFVKLVKSFNPRHDQELAEATARVEYLKEALKKTTEGSYLRLSLQTQLESALADGDRAASYVNADLTAVEDLQEEGRKAGALPGWFR